MSVTLAFIVAFETAFRKHSVHGTVSPLTNRFFSVTGNRRLGFGRRLFLAIAGLLVNVYLYDPHTSQAWARRMVRRKLTVSC